MHPNFRVILGIESPRWWILTPKCKLCLAIESLCFVSYVLFFVIKEETPHVYGIAGACVQVSSIQVTPNFVRPYVLVLEILCTNLVNVLGRLIGLKYD